MLPRRILIANRGEIACRVIAACHELGIEAIAIFSDADAGALHVRLADQAVPIGGTTAAESYLRGDRIIAAAQGVGATAIHPGYGFLSENADFAAACAEAGLVFIGPPPAAMRRLGNKIAAKDLAERAGIAILPDYRGLDQRLEVLAREAERIGYPVLIKAAAGGGGRGMRAVWNAGDLVAAAEAAAREAQSAFGDPTVFLERYVSQPRHIEVQILADTQGTVLAIGERECSVQRRHQKVLEESPSPAVDPALRLRLYEAAVTLARSAGYVNAGTVEFLLDRDGRFYFLEMNTRLQVEHPVTEAITGLDLVEWQLR
ncbi:MAG TPA: biotin carboxylase N-terminal domain-containing protein, partial [Chloroflexota bacterium]|nr:biotin carboxylase N-terminal domain-containing protein [Chloroflexota bacterium]